jgi:hypothetical protein
MIGEHILVCPLALFLLVISGYTAGTPGDRKPGQLNTKRQHHGLCGRPNTKGPLLTHASASIYQDTFIASETGHDLDKATPGISLKRITPHLGSLKPKITQCQHLLSSGSHRHVTPSNLQLNPAFTLTT